MYIFLSIVGAIVAILIILILVAPKKYHVHRSITVNRALPEVFQYLKHIKNQDHWSPWKKKDPNMKQSWTGEDGTVGFVAHWEGNKEVGEGEQEIKKIVENERVESELRFFKPWKSESDAYMQVDKADGGTKVTWGFSGVNKMPFNVFMLFMNMDKAVGKDFEEGLEELKNILES
ncbi:SRPBCC family protein [Aureitalea sp. L0-47]|uniref:SRPBCC family protein n=1 Tax=Aureitalea sp. L0-47 TaxID=2816962 RepID=UPI0022385131|nr:SRPBCC family protein [Aureitalea sp. L0-47]MCW5521197.1 SRPBCC family protein [Aureitalea sp. L0-47]